MAEAVTAVTGVFGCLKAVFDCIGKDCCPNCCRESTPEGNTTTTNNPHQDLDNRVVNCCSNWQWIWGRQRIPSPPRDGLGTATQLPSVGTITQSTHMNIVAQTPSQLPSGVQTTAQAPPVETSHLMVRVPLISVGTWGYPKCGKNFNFNDLNDIKTIKIVSNTVIHSIEVQHIKNQKLSRTSRVGREEGSSQEVVLKDGEYINEVTGYYGPLADGTGTLNSLTFHTNKGTKHGPYGSESLSDQSTEFDVRGGKIVGFYGNAEEYIHAIGFHVLPVVDPVTMSSTVYVGRWGHDYGEQFSHDGYNDIKTIKISSGRVIDSIHVQYIKGGEHVWTPKLGGGDPQGTPPNISETKELEDGEYITEVRGCYGFFYGKKHICYLTFFTNKPRSFGPYGTRHNGRNNKEITPFSVKGGKIVGFHGRTTIKYIYSIGFYVSHI